MNTHRKLGLVALLLIGGLLASCALSSASQLVGTWTSSSSGETFVFTSSNTFTDVTTSNSYAGTYTATDTDITLNYITGQTAVYAAKYTISGSTLTLTYNGSTATFTKQ